MKIVVVMSGGMDSTTCLYQLKDQGHEVRGVGINYGQRHAKELNLAALSCEKLGVPFDVIRIPNLSKHLGGSALTDPGIEVPEGHYAADNMKATVVPNRNMILMSLALGFCISIDFDAVAYGAHAGDHPIYADCRPEFASAMAQAAMLCDERPRQILRPFIHKTKADIAKLGDILGVDWGLTWSCYKGGAIHCGKCGTCVERIEAFHLAGVPDPTRYEVDPITVIENMPSVS